MARNTSISVLLMLFSLTLFGQYSAVELTYTAFNIVDYVRLDSITVMNRTRHCDTTFYYPDTVLVLQYGLGINEHQAASQRLQILKHYPNPVREFSTIEILNPAKEMVYVTISDISGKVSMKWSRECKRGVHIFRFYPGNQGLYLLTVSNGTHQDAAKIIYPGSGTEGDVRLDYLGIQQPGHQQKAVSDVAYFHYKNGDWLLSVGYSDGQESGIFESPDTNRLYFLQFATNVSCPGTPLVPYAGKVYNTVQIRSQCWLKENLDVGTMIPAPQAPKNNDTIEKYCYNNDPANCETYGGLYQWDEMMNYTTEAGGQGICPPGWHIPSFDEWKVLFGAADSKYGIGSNAWDTIVVPPNYGYDVGKNLKATHHWVNTNGTDAVGFSALGSGYWVVELQDFTFLNEQADFWTSNKVTNVDAWELILDSDLNTVYYVNNWRTEGLSVRCVKDYFPPGD